GPRLLSGTDKDKTDRAPTSTEAVAWLNKTGHAGAILLTLAEDVRDGQRPWGEVVVETPGPQVAEAHPVGWEGLGVTGKTVLGLLDKAGVIETDPVSPQKKTAQVPGFDTDPATRLAVTLN